MRCTVKACAMPSVKDSLCVFHLRDRDETFTNGMYVALPRAVEEKLVAVNSQNVDWVEVQRQRANGKSVVVIAEELGVSAATVYSHTKPVLAASRPRNNPIDVDQLKKRLSTTPPLVVLSKRSNAVEDALKILKVREAELEDELSEIKVETLFIIVGFPLRLVLFVFGFVCVALISCFSPNMVKDVDVQSAVLWLLRGSVE